MEKKTKIKKPIKTHQLPTTTKTIIHKNAEIYAVDKMTSRDFQMDINAHIETAQQILKDKVFILQFKAAIMHNRHSFRGSTVLDIGCGMGILSLFAAKIGAARVYAVDSSNVVDYTRQIVKDNKYDNIIQVIKGRLEDVELPCKEVDIIVCNWLGYSLLFQSTADAVIFARDKWLKKDGLIFPDVAKLYVAAIEESRQKNDHVEWWRDVYGFNMECFREFVLSEPTYKAVHPEEVISTHFVIKKLNMYTAKKEDLKFRTKYILETMRGGRINGIVTYFDVFFTKSHTPKGFSTGPGTPNTHWMQSVFFFNQSISVKTGDIYYGGIEMLSANKSECDLDNMEIGFEMFSGDPAQVQLEAEMRWFLKPHALQGTDQQKRTKPHITNGDAAAHANKPPAADVLTLTNHNKNNRNQSKKSTKEKKTKNIPAIVIGTNVYPCINEKKRKKQAKT